jgi:hypothetical protein
MQVLVDAHIVKLLAEFFLEDFSQDAAGVGDWLAQGGEDADEIIPKVRAVAEGLSHQVEG